MIRRISVAAALTAALVMSGCGSDKPAGDPSGTPTAASSSPIPTVTGPVAPVLPEAAKVNDDAGARAFVEYWFAAVTYAMQTGDTKPFMDVSAAECKTCAGLKDHIKGLQEAGQALEGGGWTAEGIEGDPKSVAPYWRFAVKVRQRAQKIVDTNGSVVDSSADQLFLFYAGVEWREGFEFLGLERIDD